MTIRTRAIALTVGALAVIPLAAIPTTAHASTRFPGWIHNIDGSGDSVWIEDFRKGPDGAQWLPAGRWNRYSFDVDRISAPCPAGHIMLSLPGFDRNVGHSMRIGIGSTAAVYVRGC